MDQSLRTVATQLLNNTSSDGDELIRIPDEKIISIETPMQVVHISTRVEDAIGDTTSHYEGESNSSHMKFGIPVNSKFGQFEIINPGHAMALTEEEIEREMAIATTVTAIKKIQPTTNSMLSTWIKLYPPVTTTESNNIPDSKVESNKFQGNQIQSMTSTKTTPSIVKQTTISAKPTRKTEVKLTTKTIDKTHEQPISTTKFAKIPTTTIASNFVKSSTTSSSTEVEDDVDEIEVTDKKLLNQKTTASVSLTTKVVTKKNPTKSTTPKPKNTTPKSGLSKLTKNNQHRIKPFSTRRPSVNKNETITSTSKIEKVTFKPVATKSQNRTESTEKPHFITKIKASLLTDTQKTTPSSVTMKSVNFILPKNNFSTTESLNTKVSTTIPPKVNIIRVKKPSDETTKIEIHPIRVNPPVLTIEKIEDNYQKISDDNKDLAENSKAEVNFEVYNVEVQTQTAETVTSSPPSSTTKRTRATNKRKRNKNRRRKPSTTTAVAIAANNEEFTTINSIDFDYSQQIGIQESKIEPESKAPPSKKKKPNQQSSVQKPIGTQIYNFLSREVMPSVGVMSLVGLGLGLASYFLYPFGGVIARRNYEVEPNYKYNLDEYGGNYGLSEEEVLSKVYSGMTSNQRQDQKYTPGVVGEKNPNYYRYSGPELQHSPTRYPTTLKSSNNRVNYRPVGTTSYDVSYRNTEFKYPDVPTTPNYYERQRQAADFVSSAGKVAIGNNRQFVVGNIPKEYSNSDADPVTKVLPLQDKIDTNFEYQTGESFPIINMPISPLPASDFKSLTPAALVSKVSDDQQASYEEVEITPSAVVVEHGPRYLASSIRKKRSLLPDLIPLKIPGYDTTRQERNSVIQVIPSKSEIEKEKKEIEQEEDLSNEILDIIDEALPGKVDHHKKHDTKIYHETMNKKDEKHHEQLKVKSASSSTATTTVKSIITSSSSVLPTTIESKPKGKEATSTTTTTSIPIAPTEPDFVDQGETTLNPQENISTTAKPFEPQNGMDILGIAKRIAEIKLRLGLTILKHASEGFSRYIGHIQKRFNGEE